MHGYSLYSNKQLGSFRSWVEKELNEIRYYLLEKAKDFVSEKTEGFFDGNLKLNSGRWEYLTSKKNEGYIGHETIDENGVPVIKLTYNSFKHGGHSESFDSYSALKALWEAKKYGLSLTSKSRVQKNRKSIKLSTDNRKQDVTEELILWNKLSREGHNKYLDNKSLPNLKGIRFGKNYIAVKIINTQGEFQGLQKIFEDGSKYFSAGLKKKGNFALIGSETLSKKLETIHVCEGVATAGSLHLFTSEPVFAALDAFNLEHVVKNLRLKYQKIRIIIWADNDKWKANNLDPKGLPLGNTGLIQANLTAMMWANCYVAYPEFTNLDSAREKQLTDFNDLHVNEGITALDKIIIQQPDINIGLTKKAQKLTRINHGMLSAKQFAQGNKTTLDSRFISNIQIKEGVNLIRSPIGTGKTEMVENYIKQNKNCSVIFLTHLVSLVEDAASRLQLKSYSQCDNFDLQMQRRLAICLNSITKLTAEGDLPNYDVLVIDEAEQVFKRLSSKLDQKTLIFGILKQLVKNTKTVICLDAHLSNLSVTLIKKWVNNKNINIVFNQYEVGQGRDIILYENKETLQIQAIRQLITGNNCYLTFNSKNEAKKTFHLIQKVLSEKKGLLISSDNNGDHAVQAFFNNVNEESKKYDYIICTPSISTGVSISNKHFTFVAGIFNCDINTPNDCMQAVGRVRDSSQIHIYLEKRRSNLPLNTSVISRAWHETHAYDLDLMNLSDQGQRIIICPEYESIRTKTIQERNRGHNNFFYEFCLLNKVDGYNISYSDFRLDPSERSDLKKIKTYFAKNAHIIDLSNAEFIDVTVANIIENKSRKSQSESLSYEKHKLIDFYNLNKYYDAEVNEFILLDDEGKLRRKVINFELALNDREYAIKLFKSQIEDHEQFSADLTHFATKQMLYKKLLQQLGLMDNSNIFIFKPQGYDYKYNKESLINSKFFKWMKDNHTILQGVTNLPTMEKLELEPIRFISKLLSELGLKQIRSGKTENGNYYMLDLNSISFMISILDKRGSLAGNSCNVNIVNNTQTVPLRSVPSITKSFREIINNHSLSLNIKLKDMSKGVEIALFRSPRCNFKKQMQKTLNKQSTNNTTQ